MNSIVLRKEQERSPICRLISSVKLRDYWGICFMHIFRSAIDCFVTTLVWWLFPYNWTRVLIYSYILLFILKLILPHYCNPSTWSMLTRGWVMDLAAMAETCSLSLDVGSSLKWLNDAGGGCFSSLWLWNLSYSLSITYPSFLSRCFDIFGGVFAFLTVFFAWDNGRSTIDNGLLI